MLYQHFMQPLIEVRTCLHEVASLGLGLLVSLPHHAALHINARCHLVLQPLQQDTASRRMLPRSLLLRHSSPSRSRGFRLAVSGRHVFPPLQERLTHPLADHGVDAAKAVQAHAPAGAVPPEGHGVPARRGGQGCQRAHADGLGTRVLERSRGGTEAQVPNGLGSSALHSPELLYPSMHGACC